MKEFGYTEAVYAGYKEGWVVTLEFIVSCNA